MKLIILLYDAGCQISPIDKSNYSNAFLYKKIHRVWLELNEDENDENDIKSFYC